MPIQATLRDIKTSIVLVIGTFRISAGASEYCRCIVMAYTGTTESPPLYKERGGKKMEIKNKRDEQKETRILEERGRDIRGRNQQRKTEAEVREGKGEGSRARGISSSSSAIYIMSGRAGLCC